MIKSQVKSYSLREIIIVQVDEGWESGKELNRQLVRMCASG